LKKIGLLNQDLSGVIAGMGHMDVLVVADACFVARLSGARPKVERVPHSELKDLTGRAVAVVRTGEFTPYANVILVSGVVF